MEVKQFAPNQMILKRLTDVLPPLTQVITMSQLYKDRVKLCRASGLLVFLSRG